MLIITFIIVICDCVETAGDVAGFVGSSNVDFCLSSQFYCGLGATGVAASDSATACVDVSGMCDGYNDCSNFQDELNCQSVLSNSCQGYPPPPSLSLFLSLFLSPSE